MSNKTASALWTKNFIIITLANLFIFLSFQLFPAALPVYVKSLGAPDHLLGWLTGITTVATLVVRPLTGAALDKWGRKGILLAGLAVLILVTISYGIFAVVWVILLARFVHGIGWGLTSTASTTIASDIIPKSRFGEGMGYFSLSTSIALAVSPAIALSFGFKNTVAIAVIFMVLAIVLAFGVKCPRVEPQPQNTKAALYEKASIWPSIIIFLLMVSYGAVVTFIAIYAYSLNIGGIGVYFTIYAISLLISRPFFGRLIDTRGFGIAFYPGVVLCIIALIILAFANNLSLFLLSAALYGIGFGSTQTTLQTMAVLKAPASRKGAANATFFTGFDSGIGFGCVISGILVAHIGYNGLYLLMAGLALISGMLFYIYQRQSAQPKP